MKKRLVLLDSHALLHRSYHALPGFSTYAGEPTGALFGFVKMILKIKDELKPDYIIACFDRKEATFRHEAYENYKATRAKTDDELISQIKLAPKICEAMNIPTYSSAGFEADDLLGTIIYDLKKENFNIDNSNIEVYIASGDMDTMQLIDKDNHVKVYTLKKGMGETIIYNYQDVIKRYNFTPEQIVDYKGLRGDTSDNIIGIKGIGEKTATTLIHLFNSIEEMYSLIKKDLNKFQKICKDNKITERIQKLIIENEEEAIFSKTLATIRTDAPINFSLPKKTWLEGVDEAKFLNICKEYEFRSFRNAFQKNKEKTISIESKEIKNKSRNKNELSIGGLDLNEIGQDNHLTTTEEKVLNNSTIDNEVLEEDKVLLNLINSEITNPDEETILYESDTNSLESAKQAMLKTLEKENILELYLRIEKPIINILKTMKKNGIKLDREILSEQANFLRKRLEILEKEIYKLSEEEFNISSPKQLGYILYEKLKLGEKIKKTAGGALSTNANQLEKIKDKNPIIEKVLEHKELAKLLSTYVDTLGNYVESDGRIHSTFVQTGTTTGRFSSENPNLQNLPVKSEEGLMVRKAFIAEVGYKFISIDYSQIDLRSVAILSNDPHLLEIFKSGTDVHTGVAAKVFKVKLAEVTGEMRRKAKTINFGILYGMGVTALKESMQVERKEAQEFYDDYRETFKVMIAYLEKVKVEATRLGYTETLFKRRRYVPLLKSKMPFIRSQGERIAINAPVQGTTADILKLAMIDIQNYINHNKLEGKVKMLLQIHDELVLEVSEEMVNFEEKNLKEIFENVLKSRLKESVWQAMILKNTSVDIVPLKAEVSIGSNLYELK